MAYGDQSAAGRSWTSIIIVALIHVGLAFVLINYFGVNIIDKAKSVLELEEITIEEPEEPDEPPPPEPETPETPPPPQVVTPPPPVTPPRNTNTITSTPTPNNTPTFTPKATPQPQARSCGGRVVMLMPDQPCPAPQTKTCPDGSVIPIGQACPPQTKACSDGSRVPINASCPVVVPPTPPSPRNASSWISKRDYPRSAERNGEQGRVGFRVSVGTNGRVQSCSITSSSGSSALDSATCPLIQRRAKFSPATQNGKPVTGSYSSSVTWQIQ